MVLVRQEWPQDRRQNHSWFLSLSPAKSIAGVLPQLPALLHLKYLQSFMQDGDTDNPPWQVRNSHFSLCHGADCSLFLDNVDSFLMTSPSPNSFVSILSQFYFYASCPQPVGCNPFGKPLSPKTLTLWYREVAKLLLWSSNKNNSIVGGHHNVRNCIKGSQQ